MAIESLLGEEWMTTQEVADLLRVTPVHVLRLEDLPRTRVSERCIRWKKSDVAAYLAQRAEGKGSAECGVRSAECGVRSAECGEEYEGEKGEKE